MAERRAAPQPLSKVKPKATFRFGTGVFESRPAHTAHIMRTISIGTLTEYRWSMILVDLLEADPITGMAMYEALSSSEARRAALLAAAKVRLPASDFLLFQAVGMLTAPQRKVRNKFAHHIWGESPELPETLLLIDPKHFVDVQVATVASTAAFTKRGVPSPFPKLSPADIEVYSLRALKTAERDAGSALELISDLGTGTYNSGGAEIDELLRQRLLSRPQVAQALQRLSPRNTH